MDRKRERTKIESNAIIGYAIMKYRLRCIMGILSGPVARQDEHSRGPLELQSPRPSTPHANEFTCKYVYLP